MMESWDVFLSYHREDRPVARQVYEALRGAGQAVWFDEESIPPGRLWLDAMEEGLGGSRAFVVVLSGAAPGRWVRAEVSAALRRYYGGSWKGLILPAVVGDGPETTGVLLDAFQRLTLRAEGGVIARESLVELVEALRSGAGTPAPEPRVEEPYRGLEVYKAEHQHLFFGRDAERRDLLRLLAERRWLQVEGPSGVGKSSLVRAGLVPDVERGLLGRGEAEPRVLVLRPGFRPVKELAQALHGLDPGRRGLTAIEGELEASPQALTNLAREAGGPVVLVVDQLEELFVISDPAARAAFLELLLAALADRGGPLRLVTTLRSDFLGHLNGDPRLVEALNEAGRYTVPALGREGLRQAVLGPLRLAGGTMEDGALTERLLDDATATAGRLPLLNHALFALWAEARAEGGRTLTHRAYQAVGGVAGAIDRSAEEVLRALEPRREVVRRIFLELVQVGRGSRDVRRTAARDHLLRAGGEGAEAVLARLSGGRGPDAGPGDPAPPRLLVVGDEGQVDVVHDALIDGWATLRAWLDQARRDLERREDLEAAARAWDHAGRPARELPGAGLLAYYESWEGSPLHLSPAARAYLSQARVNEARARRRRRLAVAVLAGAALLFALLGLWALQQRNLAERRLAEAREVADTILFEIDEGLAPFPEVASIRQGLLREANRLLESLRDDSAQTLRSQMVAHQRRGDQAMTHEDLDVARQEYEAALALARALSQRDMSNTGHQRDVSINLNKLGDVHVKRGDLVSAQAVYEESLGIVRRLSQHDASNTKNQWGVAVSLERLGDVHVASGNLVSARAVYEESLAIARGLSERDGSNAEYQQGVSVSLVKLGDVHVVAGDLASARVVYEASLAIRRSLSERDPSNAMYQRDVSSSLEKLGNVYVASGDLASARAAYEKSLALTRRLSERDPSNAEYQRDMSVSLFKLGDVHISVGDLGSARAAYKESLALTRGLSERDPSNAEYQRDTSATLLKLGNVYVRAGDSDSARVVCEESLAIIRGLSERDPSNAEYQRGVSANLDGLGDVEVLSGDLVSARVVYEESLAVRRALSGRDASNADFQRDVWVSMNKLAGLFMRQDKFQEALQFLEESLSIARRLAHLDPASAAAAQDLVRSLLGTGLRLAPAGGEGLAEARRRLEEAVEIMERLEREGKLAGDARGLELLATVRRARALLPPP